MKKNVAWLWLLPLIPAFAEQPKFEIADFHPSTTPRACVQSFGGVVREAATSIAKPAFLVSSKQLMAFPRMIYRAALAG